MLLELAELGAFAFFDDLLAELVELLLFGGVLLLGLPDVLDVPEAPRVPSLLVQKFHPHCDVVWFFFSFLRIYLDRSVMGLCYTRMDI